ncbi:MAG: PPC domain-containing DNA-binding protein [Prevotella sp.]|jgi:predicted DNA-binding protein with PD1-like motif
MYSYKKIDNKYIVSIDNHEEIVNALSTFCKDRNIQSGIINGIGAIGSLTLRFFNPKTKAYVDKTFEEQMEISNLIGNISSLNDEVYLHLHITVGRSDYSALAGHLLAATLNGAGEFIVEDFGEKVNRVFDPDLGLNVYDL